MYEDHFGLTQRPFGETADPSSYVDVPSRDAALRRLRYGVEHRNGPALLFGAPGSGKTLVARRLAMEMQATPILVTFPALSASDLIELLCDELGEPSCRDATLSSTLRRFRTRLATSVARGIRPLLIVDEAQVIRDDETFEVLRLLLNFTTEGPPDLSMLLVGTAELMLRIPPGLADRMTARCLLGAFSEAESAAYLQGRLELAGAKVRLFAEDALTAIHLASDGLPRRLNHLADMSLLIAFAEERSQVDARIVSIAAREFTTDPLAA